MSLHQLASLKRWHVAHALRHPVEFQAWDAMLMLWVTGWVGLPAVCVLQARLGLCICLALTVVPRGYVALRRRLHRHGVLRCDWLAAARG